MAKGGTPLTVFKASRPHRRRGNVSGITFVVFFCRFLAISETEIAHYFFRPRSQRLFIPYVFRIRFATYIRSRKKVGIVIFRIKLIFIQFYRFKSYASCIRSQRI